MSTILELIHYIRWWLSAPAENSWPFQSEHIEASKDMHTVMEKDVIHIRNVFMETQDPWDMV